ncbi:U1 zinc finger-domain-containing protein [Diaporthe sp. PMI_573]|nr:U1 zinc finger-domain-containing protein [Diaporthaceae sp. PMI_573]
MPKFFCDYCDVYLTHDSMSVRKAHNSGRNHLRNVIDYYQRSRSPGPLPQTLLLLQSTADVRVPFAEIGHEKAQSVIDSITSSYAAEGQAHNNPMLPQNQPGGGAFPPAGMPFPPPFPGGIPPPGFPALPGGSGGPSAPGAPPGNFPFPPPMRPGSNSAFPPFPPPGAAGGPGGGAPNLPPMPIPPPGSAGGLPFPPPGGLPFPPPGAGGAGAPPNFPFPPPGGFPGGVPPFNPAGGPHLGPPGGEGR